jgi:hypothetical protein
MTRWQLFKKTILPTWLVCAPVLALLVALRWLPSLRFENTWATLFTHGPVVAGLAYALLLRFAATPEERAVIARKLPFLKSAPTPTPAVQEAA